MIEDYYINGRWLRNPQDPPKDYDLAIFIYRKSEADILKNKVSDSIIKNINDNNDDNNIRSVFEDYNDYKYISLSIFNSYYFRTLVGELSNRIVNYEGKPYLIIRDKNIYRLNEINTNLVTPKIINIAIVIFEKKFYVFADDKLIDWIDRVVDMFKQDVDKFKQEKRVLGSVFVYYFLFVLMSDLNLMLEDLYGVIYDYSKQSRTIIERKIPELDDQEIQTNLMKKLNKIKDLILELRLYFKNIKKVLIDIRPLFRETSEYYNKLSDIKEECDDELYNIEQNIQSNILTTSLFIDFKPTQVLILLTIVSLGSVFLSIFDIGSRMILIPGFICSLTYKVLWFITLIVFIIFIYIILIYFTFIKIKFKKWLFYTIFLILIIMLIPIMLC